MPRDADEPDRQQVWHPSPSVLTTKGAGDLSVTAGGRPVRVLKWGMLSHAVMLALQAGSEAAAADAVTPEVPELIVITATQRTMAALDVPASVSVFAGDRLQGTQINTVKQLVSLTPALGTI